MTIKKLFFLFVLLINSYAHAQEKQIDSVILFLDLKKETTRYSFSKDTSSISFGFYRKKFESKKSRDSITKLYSYRGKKRIQDFEDLKNIKPKYLPEMGKRPNFSLDFWSIGKPTKRIKSIKGIDYINKDRFISNEMNYLSKKIYILHKVKDGSYMIWEVVPVPLE
ncbi:hypothetical protein [Flavobacterium tructae]|uniref:GLPGLI family protein n=1 Tax=Flavobacterium tructae TaxID=1114873 RepID=A0A1S1JB67_9FLAO|nr:hypothetical protein [Flavobacterium tructae]OHT47040.1 hypothetical protein BHE19_21890 [Flavobacterium tructae]OXB14398.1 hypothetical protein B0A71_21700 [Flavobacterium tructae]